MAPAKGAPATRQAREQGGEGKAGAKERKIWPTWTRKEERRPRGVASPNTAFSNPAFEERAGAAAEETAEPPQATKEPAAPTPAEPEPSERPTRSAGTPSTAPARAETRDAAAENARTQERPRARRSLTKPITNAVTDSENEPPTTAERSPTKDDDDELDSAIATRADIAERLSIELAKRLAEAEAAAAKASAERDSVLEELEALRAHVSRDKALTHGARIDGADSYRGFLSEDGRKPEYYGVCVYGNGDRYVGGWLNGNPNGFGTCTFALGNRYVGGWKNGGYHGDGTYRYANGDVYQGTWKDDVRQGDGMLTEKDGTAWIEVYEAGKLLSRDAWKVLAADVAAHHATPTSSPTKSPPPQTSNGMPSEEKATRAAQPGKAEWRTPPPKAQPREKATRGTPSPQHEALKNVLYEKLKVGDPDEVLESARELLNRERNGGVKGQHRRNGSYESSGSGTTNSSGVLSPQSPASRAKPSFMRSVNNPIGASSPDSDNTGSSDSSRDAGDAATPMPSTPHGMTESEALAHEERRRRMDVENTWLKNFKKARWREHVSRARSHLEKAYEEFKGNGGVPFSPAPSPSPLPERPGFFSSRNERPGIRKSTSFSSMSGANGPLNTVQMMQRKALEQHNQAFEMFESTLCGPSSRRNIRFDDIPWPPRAALAGLAESIGAKNARSAATPANPHHRKMLLRLKSRWHPDKWQGRRLHDGDRARILKEVTSVFQAVDALRRQSVAEA